MPRVRLDWAKDWLATAARWARPDHEDFHALGRKVQNLGELLMQGGLTPLPIELRQKSYAEVEAAEYCPCGPATR